MTFKYLPSVLASEFMAEDDKFAEQKRRQIEKSIEQINKKYEKKAKKIKVYKEKFSSYLFNFCKCFAVVCAVFGMSIPMTLGSLTGGDETMGIMLVVSAIFGAIYYGLFGGAVGGVILGLILSPIGYPIYRRICEKNEDKVAIKKKKLEDEKAEKIALMKKPILEEIEVRRANTQKRIFKYTEAFEKEAEAICDRFENSGIVNEAVQLIIPDFRSDIENLKRLGYSVAPSYVIAVDRHNVHYGSAVYRFEGRGYEEIDDVTSLAALTMVIAKKIGEEIKQGYDGKIDICYKYPEKEDSVFNVIKSGEYITAWITYNA